MPRFESRAYICILGHACFNFFLFASMPQVFIFFMSLVFYFNF
jgi:hypothetical protein